MRSLAAVVEAPELVEGWVTGAPRPIPITVEPFARMCSPIMEHRGFEAIAPAEEGPAVVLPPLSDLKGPTAVAVLVAAPLALVAGWQLGLAAGLVATILREVERRVPASYSFAAAFMPYRRDDAWPHGVREDDDVRWNWSASYTAPKSAGADRTRA